ncbi:MAG: glycosyltransferase [Balneolaceae bacterium]
MRYSIIIPVYNRPHEIDELLLSLTEQSYKSFEVIIVEDGSDSKCDHLVKQYQDVLDIRYYYKENSGQGFSRNYGFKRAQGDYFVVFDSDCIIPPHYFEAVNKVLETSDIDCWGGPDRAESSFTVTQKAINFSMTSFLTTGGIRGQKKSLDSFLPRSFNMGISKEVFENSGGYKITRMGEDLEFSIRIRNAGFNVILIEDAFVFHKRRTNLIQFFKQLHFFGRARINISRFHPEEIKFVHCAPLFFFLGLILIPISFFIFPPLCSALLSIYSIYGLSLFLTALFKEKNPIIGFLAIIAGYIQLSAYGIGFLYEWARKK